VNFLPRGGGRRLVATLGARTRTGHGTALVPARRTLPPSARPVVFRVARRRIRRRLLLARLRPGTARPRVRSRVGKS
jgi:hypothetical protein